MCFFPAVVTPLGRTRITPHLQIKKHSTSYIFQRIDALPNQMSTFTCHALAIVEHNLTYQWTYTRDNSIVSNDQKLGLRSTATAGGIYQCRVSNRAGVGTSNATLNGKIVVLI